MLIHYYTLLLPIIVPSSKRVTKQGKLKKEKKQGKHAWTMPGQLEKVKEKKQCKLQKYETRQGKQGESVNTLLLHTEFEGLRDAGKERKWGSGQTADKSVDVGD